jgi:nicotinamidase-related amidase
LRASQSALLVIDMQTRLAPAVRAASAAIANTTIMVRAAQRLNVPVLVIEQYPKGLGRTVPELVALIPPESVTEKVYFSCMREDGWTERLEALGRRQAVIAGMETHVCVLQAAIELKEKGYVAFVVADATSSRRVESHIAALDRMRAAGVTVATTEMVVFEWLERADTAQFRDLLKLIK